MRRTARLSIVTSIVLGLLAVGGSAALADSAGDPYCDVLLPVLRDHGYNGEDPRCTA